MEDNKEKKNLAEQENENSTEKNAENNSVNNAENNSVNNTENNADKNTENNAENKELREGETPSGNEGVVPVESPDDNLKKKGTNLDPEKPGFMASLYIKLPERSSGPFRYLRDFFTCLEFLTVIRITKRINWFPDDFARSVPYFPLVGGIMGLMMFCMVWLGDRLHLGGILLGVFLVLMEMFCIGTLMYDGFMDTCDGIFSGRTRERKLEIMQDSHVGANAVMGSILLVFFKVTLFASFPIETLVPLLIAMYITTRTFMVIYILCFPNARPGGLGAMFRQGGSPWYLVFAIVIAMLLLWQLGSLMLFIALMALVPCMLTAFYLKTVLGGLTGDTFGALTECGNIYFLLCAYYLLSM